MNSVQRALEWLYRTQDSGVKLGLDNVQQLLAKLGNPHRSIRCIHVAGTNGKGSVCAMLDAICRAAGKRVGLFTSPHLVRFNERIQINGQPVSDDHLLEGLEEIRSVVAGSHEHPTFFEITTAFAFAFFARQQCELVILETGLGGRLDATNVVTPLVSVLTAIDFDHQKWLGNTLREIAREKAGIIKPGIPVVSFPQHAEAAAAIQAVAEQNQAPLSFVKEPIQGTAIALPGAHQRFNASLAIAALAAAKIEVPWDAVLDGLVRVRWPGRFQYIRPNFVLDGAHNPAAIAQLVQTWHECFGQTKAVVIFGALRDKAIKQMLTIVGAIASEIRVVPVNSRRAASPAEIEVLAGPTVQLAAYSSLQEALMLKQASARPVLATGSLFLIGEILATLEPGYGEYRSSLQ
jgi:dihydrofolate synthase / folylpolyglutamate synthase